MNDLTLDDLKEGAAYSVKQAAQVLGVCGGTVRNAIDRGDLLASRVGGIRILGKDIKDYWHKKQMKPRGDRRGVPSPPKAQHRPLKHIRLRRTDG
jgi:excisionase family DNA binding protein